MREGNHKNYLAALQQVVAQLAGICVSALAEILRKASNRCPFQSEVTLLRSFKISKKERDP